VTSLILVGVQFLVDFTAFENKSFWECN